MTITLVSEDPQFIVPSGGARVRLVRSDGHAYFTGYLTQAAEFEYLGWGPTGPAYRFKIEAESDEWLIDQKRLQNRPVFVMRAAGDILKKITQDAAKGSFDVSLVQDLEVKTAFDPTPQKQWSAHAAGLALECRAAYRAHDGKLSLAAIGTSGYTLDESDESSDLTQLRVQAPKKIINDVTVIGKPEPRAYVKNYFLGDGVTTSFHLSHSPFAKKISTVAAEEFETSVFNPYLWSVADPTAALSSTSGKAIAQGGSGLDGQTILQFAEQLQLGGTIRLQHGVTEFLSATDAVIGGLYTGAIVKGNCFAGFKVSPSGTACSIQAMVNGVVTGSAMTTIAGHRYAMTTRVYCLEPYRTCETFHSAEHVSGSGRGGAAVNATVRIVLEVHDLDPTNAASLAAPATVLFDGTFPNAPGYCNYALLNALNAHCSISFVEITAGVDALVRSTIPGSSVQTRLVGNVAEGSECTISQSGNLRFYSPYLPVANEAIEVEYRSSAKSIARVLDSASITANAKAGDDGTRAKIVKVNIPDVRTAIDCENAAQAILDDSVSQEWSGSYKSLNLMLPGGAASDPLPGESLHVIAPSRSADFVAILQDVTAIVVDASQEILEYQLSFCNDAAAPFSFEFAKGSLNEEIEPVVPGTSFIAALPDAVITAITSTTMNIDAGTAPQSGGGIEVRRSDSGWDAFTDHNLTGRFTTQTMTLPRLARIQTYYLRQFDSSNPPRYSRYSTVLHVDYPF